MKTKILLIEDDLELRNNFEEILNLKEYEVVTVANGIEGIEALKIASFDLVISDIMMPGLDGYGVLSYIRNLDELSNLPVILLTAKIDNSDIRDGMEKGADDYITKPVSINDLLNAIESVLNKKNQREKFLKRTLDNALSFERKVRFHELKTPVFVLISILEYLEENLILLQPQEIQNLIFETKKSAIRLNKSILKLNNYLELNDYQCQIKWIEDPKKCFLKEINKLNPTIPLKITGTAKPIYMDKDCFSFIISELLENALKFKKPDTKIKLQFKKSSLKLINEQNHIPQNTTIDIQPFFQYERHTNEQQGLGLGLYICKEYALKNNMVLNAYVDNYRMFNVYVDFKNTFILQE